MTTSRPGPAEDQALTAKDGGAAGPRPSLLERTILDEQVAATRRLDLGLWGLLSWLGPLLTLAALIVAGRVVVLAVGRRHLDASGGLRVALTIGAELLMLGALVAFGRPIAGRTGGWRAGFGLDWIRRIDWLPWITGFGFIYLGRTVISGLANGLTDGKALQQASNVHFDGVSPWAIALFGFVAVVLAPVTEELMFRGLLLRSFMRRMRFWPAALLSTALFALFHVYEVHTVIGAVTLACSVAVLGLGNSYLVRITGRLTPGIMAHACFNALALLVAIAQAAH